MQRKKKGRFILAGVLLISLTMCALWLGQALGSSGIRLKQSIAMADSTNPPPHQTRENIFRFVIENENDVCNEDVKITKALFMNDPLADRDGLVAKGYAKFLGFKRNLGDSYLADLKFELEDETETTIYFGVETGEDGSGCDFQAFNVRLLICDTGPHGFFDCDNYDGDIPCEEPTPFSPELTIDAAAVAQPSGSGKIFGKVTNNAGKGVLARIRITKMGGCVIGDPDNTDTYNKTLQTKLLPVLEKGTYEESGLPFGNYKVVARKDGAKQSKDVSINSGTPTIEVNFVFP